MRTAWILALAVIGVFSIANPCAAQSGGVLVAGNSSAYSKTTAAPERLSPADTETQAAAPQPAPPATPARTEQAQPAVPAAAPAATTARQSVPDSFYDRPTFQAQEQPAAETTNVPAAHLPAASIPAPGPHGVARAPAGLPASALPPVTASSEPETPYAGQPEFSSSQRLLDWVSNYRDRPQYWKVPAAVHAMRDHGLFTDEEQRWFCVGFIAGVLGTNPKDGPGLIPKMFPMPPKEQEVIIRAIAYSGRPDWQDLLVKHAGKMPLRKPLIDDFLNGERPTLQKIALDVGGTPAVYAHWGYYVASGQHEPVMRIMQALKWSKGAQKQGFFGKLTSGWGADASKCS